jgi:cytochrome c biogenesis protein CcdA
VNHGTGRAGVRGGRAYGAVAVRAAVLPLVMGSAAHTRLGPAALAAGFVATFTLIGVVLASLGTTLGLSDSIVRRGSAALLIVAGVLLISHLYVPRDDRPSTAPAAGGRDRTVRIRRRNSDGGASVGSGLDKLIESVVLVRLPQWWIDLVASV